MPEEALEFEKIFEQLLKFSEIFEIKYDYKLIHHKENTAAQYRIIGVNDNSTYQFRSKIEELGNKGIEILKKEKDKVEYEYRVSYLKEINDQLKELKFKVEDDIYVVEESEYGPRKEIHFKRFIDNKIIPFNEERTKGHKKSILEASSEYANAWIEKILEISRKIEFLINQQELLPEPEEAIKDKNTITLFYSWQSDNKDETKKIRKALTKLEKFYRDKDLNLKIESDMRNTSGSQDIPNTLFKKISESDIFIADVNLIGLSVFRNDGIPNPNVLIELGFAAAKLGWNRIVILMNTDQNKIEELPFDIRQRSILWYNSKDDKMLENKLIEFVKAITD